MSKFIQMIKKYITPLNIVWAVVGVVLSLFGIISCLISFSGVSIVIAGTGIACLYGLKESIQFSIRSVCSSCGKRMKGAAYEIEVMSEDTDDKRSVATVQVTATCPFCGENNYFTKKVTTASIDSQGKVRRTNPTASLNNYCKRLYRDKDKK